MESLAHLARLGRETHAQNGMIDYGILGAGPAGLSMAMFLDGTSEVLEGADHPGGHAASFFEDGFTFDYGPHIMFSKNKPVLQFMIDSLEGNVHECRRKNVVSFRNRLVKYPFENALAALPLEDNLACLKGYVYNPYKAKYPQPANLREWLLATFGDGICERYLFPYNEKVWNMPVEDLSMIWADRIPNPDPEDILKSAIGFETEGYLHQLYYHYPRRGGYQALSEAWARRVPVNYGFRITALERRNDAWVVSDGRQTREYRQIVSTLPIQQLVTMTNLEIPAEVQAAIDGLIVNPMFIISLGIRATDSDQYTAIYFPEPEFLVNRISFPATLSPDNAPAGTYSIQAEITCRAGSDTWAMSDEAICEHTIDGLVGRGIIRSRDAVIYRNVQRKTYSYVVYDRHYAENTRIIREWFPRHGLHLAGRFGFVEYANVDGILIRNLEIASQLNGRTVTIDEMAGAVSAP
jgi:protoporphyrinogen oxidase